MSILVISKDRPWTDKLSKELIEYDHDITHLQKVCESTIKSIDPKFIFFFHWSEKVSRHIYENYKCIVIHTSCLPKGRGGSPIQNQILKNKSISKVNLIEMCEHLDAGGIFCSEQISLQGNINDIWNSIAVVTASLINKCVTNNLKAIAQSGEAEINKRISTNEINFDKSIEFIYNQIRMVDSDFYPNAFILLGDFKLEFSRAKLEKEKIITDVRITREK